MKATEKPPVSVCRVTGEKNRFFGKYRDPAELDPKKAWKKIPGGAYPPAINSKAKALACAARWYEDEMARRKTARPATVGAPGAWPAVCDAFMADVKARAHGAAATKDELVRRAGFLKKDALLCSRPIGDHDDDTALAWIRAMLTQPRVDGGEPRDPLTVRNVAKVLDAIYRFAQRRGGIARDRRLPTQSDEFKAELSGALREKAKLGKLTRVACPVETARAVVLSAEVSALRRVMTATYFYTGLRPGELHGLHVGDIRHEDGVRVLDVHHQWALPRTKVAATLAPLKTVWSKRLIPVHPALAAQLDRWLEHGWKEHVGRVPKDDDFIFVDDTGAPFREQRCQPFLDDIVRAGASPMHRGVELDVYSLRHTFATVAKRSGIPADLRDRLLGHRPRDTKALHYEDEDIALLAQEVAKIPALTDASSKTPPDPSNGDGKPPRTPRAAVPETAALVRSLGRTNAASFAVKQNSSMISAEETRFELVDPLRDRRFSKPLP